MNSAERLMNRVRERMAEDSEREQDLHEKALELDLHPQPWWNREFYEHAIRVREVELETEGGEDEDEYKSNDSL